MKGGEGGKGGEESKGREGERRRGGEKEIEEWRQGVEEGRRREEEVQKWEGNKRKENVFIERRKRRDFYTRKKKIGK